MTAKRCDDGDKKMASKIYSRAWIQAAGLVLFCAFLYFLNLGQWDLWGPDEPRYAQVAKEMVYGGDWILMHFNGTLYQDKPPLFFWLVGLSSYLWGGFNSFSVRFPSAVSGTLTVLLTLFLGRSLYNSGIGFLSGLILATSVGFFRLSTKANIDTTLTFFTTASFCCFILWYRFSLSGEAGSKSVGKTHIRNLSIYGFYIAMALGTLTKGPVGFLLPLLASLVYLIVRKDWKGVKGMNWWPGAVLFLVIVLAWYAPALWKGGKDYLYATLKHHSWDRFAKGTAHILPFYFYLYEFPAYFLPWTLFLPAAVAYGYSKEALEKRKEFLFLWIWFIVVFLFFSVSKGKRALYLLPLLPAASLIVGKLCKDITSLPVEGFSWRWLSFPLYGLMGLMLLGGAAIAWIVSIRFPFWHPQAFPLSFLLVGGGFSLFILCRLRKFKITIFAIIAITAVSSFYTLRVIFPDLNEGRSARSISEEVTSRDQPSERLGIYRLPIVSYVYYTGIVPTLELESEEMLLRFLGSRGRVYCILQFSDFCQFQRRQEISGIQMIARRKIENRDVVLISNR